MDGHPGPCRGGAGLNGPPAEVTVTGAETVRTMPPLGACVLGCGGEPRLWEIFLRTTSRETRTPPSAPESAPSASATSWKHVDLNAGNISSVPSVSTH